MPIKRVIRQSLNHIIPAAAGSTDCQVYRIRAMIRSTVRDGGTDLLIRALVRKPAHDAIDELFLLAGFSDQAPNRRQLMARHLAYTYGHRGPLLVLLLLLDICRDDVVSVGGCLAWRIQRLLKGEIFPRIRRKSSI